MDGRDEKLENVKKRENVTRVLFGSLKASAHYRYRCNITSSIFRALSFLSTYLPYEERTRSSKESIFAGMSRSLFHPGKALVELDWIVVAL